MNQSIDDFYLSQDRFRGLSTTEQITRLAWYLHTERGLGEFSTSDITNLYRELHLQVPQVSVYLPRLAKRTPPVLLVRRGDYILEGRERGRLDDILKDHPTVVIVSKLLSDLVGKIEDESENAFLSEAMKCYKVGAFRAAIVMIWNLGFYHLRDWVWADRSRIDQFNDGIKKKYPKKDLQISCVLDFEELKEFEFIEICHSSKLLSKNIVELLKDKLRRRNSAAHPSAMVFSQPQADDVISEIINNIIIPFAR